MKLTNKNGLAALVEKETNGKAETYIDNTTVSVFWMGATQQQIQRLKVLIADYIDRKMMMQSYETVKLYF